MCLKVWLAAFGTVMGLSRTLQFAAQSCQLNLPPFPQTALHLSIICCSTANSSRI
jgi:hypothetical protein